MTETRHESLREAMERQFSQEKLAAPASRKFVIRLVSSLSDNAFAAIGAVAARVAELEQRLADTEYRGVWRAGETYRKGNFVSASGSTWHCNVSGTNERPGSGSPDWTLAAKAGRDGKDLR